MPMKVVAAVFVALAFAAPAAAQPKLTPAQEAAITRSIDVFVNHAVKRSNPQAAFDVVAPEMRPDMTRKNWKGGDIPVYPFPAAGRTHPWNVLYVTREEVGLELQLQPRAGSKQGPIIFHIYLRPAGKRWLVDSFMPVATLAPLDAKHSKVRSVRDFSPQSARRDLPRRWRPAPPEQHLGRAPVRADRLRLHRARGLGPRPRRPQPAACRARAAARCLRSSARAVGRKRRLHLAPMALELGRVTDRKPPFKYSSLIRVGFSDTDAQGIVYYGRYLPYFDSARVEYHRHLEMLVTEPREHEFVMRANTIEYHAPARFDDLIEVFIRVSRIGRTSVTYEHAPPTGPTTTS